MYMAMAVTTLVKEVMDFLGYDEDNLYLVENTEIGIMLQFTVSGGDVIVRHDKCTGKFHMFYNKECVAEGKVLNTVLDEFYTYCMNNVQKLA